jgi:hypothetical protein
LLDFAVLDGAKLNDLSVCGRENCIGIGIQGADSGFEGAVEEGGEVGVYM